MAKRRELFTPRTDGIDHLNVYSRARTAGGKLLSNFSRSPFVLDGHRFESVEGFYHTLLFDHEEVRARLAGMWGAPAKSWGKLTRKRPGDPVRTWDGRTLPFEGPEFDAEVRRAMTARIEQDPEVQDALLNTERLPLTHYYIIMGRPVLPRNERDLLVTTLTSLRTRLRTDSAIGRLLGPLAGTDVGELLATLKEGADSERLDTARALAFRQDGDQEAIAHALADVLNHSPLTLGHRALRTLVQLNLNPPVAEPMYRRALGHDCPTVRIVAARKLGELGPPARGAIPALRGVAGTDTDSIVRRFAEQAIEEIDPARSLLEPSC